MEAGLVEFGLLGYHGAATAAIAARAGVSQPHLYASFRTKRDLFVAVCADACARAADAAGVSAAREPDPDLARLVLQAVAASRDPELSEPLAEPLGALREAVGGPAFAALLDAGGRAMLAV